MSCRDSQLLPHLGQHASAPRGHGRAGRGSRPDGRAPAAAAPPAPWRGSTPAPSRVSPSTVYASCSRPSVAGSSARAIAALAVVRGVAASRPRAAASRARAPSSRQSPGLDREARLQLRLGLARWPYRSGEVAEPQMEPRELLPRHAVPPLGLVPRPRAAAGGPPPVVRAARPIAPAVVRYPDLPGRSPAMPSSSPGLLVVPELEEVLAQHPARRDRGRVVGEQPPRYRERLGESMLRQQARGQDAECRAVAAGAQLQRMAGVLLGPGEVAVVRRLTRALEVEAGELGEVSGAPRVAHHPALVELDVAVADLRLARRGRRRTRPGAPSSAQSRRRRVPRPAPGLPRGSDLAMSIAFPPRRPAARVERPARSVSSVARDTGRWWLRPVSRTPRCRW